MALENIHVLSVLTEGYNLAMEHWKEMKRSVLRVEKEMNATLVQLIWSFIYQKLPKLNLNSKLKKAKERIQRERIERRENERNVKRSKSVKSVTTRNKRSKSTAQKLKGRKASKSVTA